MQIFTFWFQVIFCLNLYSDCMRGQNQFIDKQEEDTKNILGQIQLVKFRQSKNKRKPIPVEKEKLYDENYQLRNRIKELQEMNLRLRTRLTVAQKQKEQIFSKAQQQHSSPQVPKRSHSGMYKISHPAPFDGKNNITLQKQKHNQVFKKLIRDKDFQIERLRMELQSLKKTMKFTRLNELRYQNDELIEQTKRLRSIIEDNRSANDKYSNQYLRENDQLRRLLQNEGQKQKKNGNALKKKIQEMNQLKQRMRDCQLRKVQMEKRLNKDIKALKAEQLQLKSKLNQDLYLSKQCTKQECNKAKKERADYKKKVEQLQKQLKGVKQQLVGQRKRIVQKQVHYQKLLTQEKQKSNSTKKQLPSKQIPAIIHNDTFTKRDNIELIKKQQKQSIDLKQDASHQKETNSLPSKSLIQDKADTKITEDKVSPKVNNFHQAKPQTSKLSFDKSNKNEQSTVLHQVKGQQSMKKPTEQAYDSDNTEKLLESSSQIQASPVEQKKDKKATLQKDKKEVIQKNKKATLQNDNKIQNSLQVKEKRKTSKNVDKQLQEYQQFNQQFNQDAEQYQKIEFDEQQVKPQKNKVNQSQEVKQKKKKKENSKKKLKNDEKAPKSKKKQEKKIESDEELLYQKQQKAQNDPTKLQLKEIRQTLTYKFIAQRCDYETFVQIIKARNQKVLSVQEVMNILQDQPCILDEKDIQIVTIYCFQTESFTGQQALPVKDFLKKMKKFVGKIKLPSQEEESENVEQLIHFIYEDQSGKKILRKQFGKIDSGDGMVGKQQFISVLKGAKIGSKLIQTALAQIVYVSQDINHLNYVLFLNRFVEEVERTA